LKVFAILACLYTEQRKKAVKIVGLKVNMFANGGDIEVKSRSERAKMAGTSKKPAKGQTTGDGGKKPPPKVVEEDEEEDGDFATPKRDRHGDDDQPL
jgi:hypothetical protein